MKSDTNTLSIWLESPTRCPVEEKYPIVIRELQRAQISYHTDGEPGHHAVVLLVFDGQVQEGVEEECIQEHLQNDCRIIVLDTLPKPMPFYRIWDLLGAGVEDVLRLHCDPSFTAILKAKLSRWKIIDHVMNTDQVRRNLIGHSPAWLKTLRHAIEIACFSSTPVLVLGESGTGKELISRLIHDLDRRPDKQDFVLLDCTTIVSDLSGSEFFGHEKGAFTNAISTREGAFALADKGTLFLDEVGELPMKLQAELLRVSQEGAYKRVGSNIWRKTAFRLICATNRNLKEEIRKGRFREDLYYRLSSCIIRLPPLRERKWDIPELANYFLKKTLSTDHPPPFDPLVTRFLMTLEYPGNVRQLQQLISRMAYRHSGNRPITIGDISDVDRQRFSFVKHQWKKNGLQEAIQQALSDGVGLKEIKKVVGDMALELAIKNAAGNLQKAARCLEVSDRLVQGWMKENQQQSA